MLWVITVVVVLALSIMLYRAAKRKPRYDSKVVKLSDVRARAGKAASQPCSFCKKKAAKLTFYASEQGQVVGVCGDCRSQAEKRSMLPL